MKLRNWRLNKNLTLQEVADLCGLRSRMTVSRHERDPADPQFRMPPPETLRTYKRVTGGAVTADDFVTLIDTPPTEGEAA